MNCSALFIFLLMFGLWTDFALSKEIKYEEIRTLVLNANGKAHSLEYQIESARLKTGHLGRSFIPEVTLFAGQENFESDPLGARNTNFFGIDAKANIFNGMSDYWEEKRRESKYYFQKVTSAKDLNDIVYAAQESYLKIAEIKSVIHTLSDGIEQLNQVRSKVVNKVSGGVIGRSDLTSISLVKVGFEEDIRQINRNLVVEVNKLSVLLGADNLTTDNIDESIMERNLTAEMDSVEKELLDIQMIDAQAKMKLQAAKSAGAKRLPSLDLFANYSRVPFSAREFTSRTDRMELQAGVQATWRIGDYFEKSREAASFRAESVSLEKLKVYNKKRFEYKIKAIKTNLYSLLESINGISSEVNLSKNYYKQISAEYLRGVKSTSDLTTAFNQLLFLKQRRLNLIVQFYISKAEIDRQTQPTK